MTSDYPARRVFSPIGERRCRREWAKRRLDYDLDSDSSPFWTEIPFAEREAATEAVPDSLLETQVSDSPDDWTPVTTIAEGNPNVDFPAIGVFEPDLPTLRSATVESHHDGLVFEDELYDMTAEAKPILKELLDGDVVVEEMPYCGKFRTDLAICDIQPSTLRKRLSMTGDSRPLNEEWKFLKSHRYIRANQPITREEFVNGRQPYVPDTSKTVWNWLRDRNLIATNGTGYCTVVEYPIHITAHAVELKPRDWQTALGQAARATRPERYTGPWGPTQNPSEYGYADYRWVVMDAGSVDEAVRHERHFRELGVGLISLDRGGAVKLIDAERRTPPERALDREHLNEKTLEAIDVDEYLSEFPSRTENHGPETGDKERASERNTSLGEFQGKA